MKKYVEPFHSKQKKKPYFKGGSHLNRTPKFLREYSGVSV